MSGGIYLAIWHRDCFAIHASDAVLEPRRLVDRLRF
jgi:hypothetical protein